MNIARFLKYVCPFFLIMYESAKKDFKIKRKMGVTGL